MSAALTQSRRLLAAVGPGSMLLAGARDDALLIELLRQGCDAFVDPVMLSMVGEALQSRCRKRGARGERYDCVVLHPPVLRAAADADGLFTSLRASTRRFVAIVVTEGGTRLPDGRDQADHWANAAIRAGFRRAPGAGDVAFWLQFDAPQLPEMMVFERIPEDAVRAHPLEALLADRDLHMDMSREFGPRSDAHIVRYVLASQWVRPGDVVLDCACGLGYGSAALASRTAAQRVIGVDIDQGSVDYARAQFAAQYGVEYHCASGDALEFLEDASVDVVVSFETIEHVEDYHRLIDEFARVLKPDGRLVASVPNLWVDETGRDPNPYHFHAFDWEKLREAVGRRFLVEARYRQEAPGGFKLHTARRDLARVGLDETVEDTEWWIVVASADPRVARGATYVHPQFARSAIPGTAIADFGAHYRNPWLYRTLVQMGERLKEDALLFGLAASVVEQGDLASADFGAAATVMAYALLARRQFELVPDLLTIADQYLAQTDGNPHVRRWKISLAFAGALGCLATGERRAARDWFGKAAELDPLGFSPLLATKTVAARFWSGMLDLVDGRKEDARAEFVAGVEAARRALHAPDPEAIGDPSRPLEFGFQELAEVADMASQCAIALNGLERFARSPGGFWSAVDTRRFGLASWLLQLEHENLRLRSELASRAS